MQVVAKHRTVPHMREPPQLVGLAIARSESSLPPVSPGNSSDQVLQGLVALGCSYEGANPGYMSANIPPGLELQELRSYLVQNDAQWEHADPIYESLFPDKA